MLTSFNEGKLDLDLESLYRCKISSKTSHFTTAYGQSKNANDFAVLDLNISTIVSDTNILFHFFSLKLRRQMGEVRKIESELASSKSLVPSGGNASHLGWVSIRAKQIKVLLFQSNT